MQKKKKKFKNQGFKCGVISCENWIKVIKAGDREEKEIFGGELVKDKNMGNACSY